MGQPLLTVEDLRVSYPARQGRLMAVNGVSFTLARGETFGLVGESGSGKTTMAMAILRLLKPPAQVEGGCVLMDGGDIFALPPHELRETRWRKLALIPQGAMNSLNPVMRIQDQIEDVIIVHERLGRRRSLRDRVAKLLHTVDLPERVCDMYPHELSGGMKQRVCIAMAIALVQPFVDPYRVK
jgi:ABC-type glutathione transport system ATPase component